MNVLFITPTFYPASIFGGPIESTLELCRALSKIGKITVHISTTDSSGWKGNERLSASEENLLDNEKFSVSYYRKLWGSEFSPKMLMKMREEIAVSDVVHITYLYSFSTIVALWYCRVNAKPIVLSPRGACQYWQGTKKRIFKKIWNKCCRLLIKPTDIILHATSSIEKTDTENVFPESRVEVISNGVIIPKQSIVKSKLDYVQLLFLGRLDPIKGLENLITAMHLLKSKTNTRFLLNIYGNGAPDYNNELQKLVNSLDLTNNVIFHGHLERNEKSNVFRKMHLTIVPSHSENFGMTIAESLAHEVPVIASKGTPWQRLDEMKCGLWVENSPETLANSIIQLQKQDLKKMGRLGRNWMKQEYAWETVGKQMSNLYCQLIEKKRDR